jgi:hypothetical protein
MSMHNTTTLYIHIIEIIVRERILVSLPHFVFTKWRIYKGILDGLIVVFLTRLSKTPQLISKKASPQDCSQKDSYSGVCHE